ncbi:hypothetical protein XENOCAPTIV_030139, partial [Xenoophorus captivus]
STIPLINEQVLNTDYSQITVRCNAWLQNQIIMFSDRTSKAAQTSLTALKSQQQVRTGDQEVRECRCDISMLSPAFFLPVSLPGVKKPLGQYGPPGVADTTSGSTPAASKEDDDDDIDLFGSDEEEDAEAAKLKEQRLAEYAAKKAKKPALIAKSSLLLDVKPWDDETDMAKLEECVRSIEMDGLVGTDILEEKITAFEDHVQSMDVSHHIQCVGAVSSDMVMSVYLCVASALTGVLLRVCVPGVLPGCPAPRMKTSSRGSAPVYLARSNQSRLTLLERFLQDVQEHHPHRYSDARPSHADLPSVSVPLLPKVELDEVCSSDSQSLGTQEHLPSSDDASCQPANEERECSFHSQSGRGAGHAPCPKALPPCINTPPLQSQAPPSVHRKAHRKTNRRKPSESSSSTHTPRALVLQAQLDPSASKRRQAPAESNAQTSSGPTLLVPTGPRTQFPSGQRSQYPTKPKTRPLSGPRPFVSWQRERREVQKEEAFSLHTDPVEQTIEEVGGGNALTDESDVDLISPADPTACSGTSQVIQMCCHSLSSPNDQQEEVESLHLSLPITMETQSEDWDTPVQVCMEQKKSLFLLVLILNVS